MPKGQPRVPKSREERIGDCETHLAFLKEALDKYPADRERYKQVAGELRVLVCKSGKNKPLLLDLMDEYGFKYVVQRPAPPQGPPIKGPIPLVGFRDDPVQQELAKELEQALGDEEKLNAILTRQESLNVPLPLRRFVDEGLAAYVPPYEYSYNHLTRAIAEQSGVAHEDDAIEEGLAAMRNFRIVNDHSHIYTLIRFADTVLDAGLKFLGFMVETQHYQPQRFQFSSATVQTPGPKTEPRRFPWAWALALIAAAIAVAVSIFGLFLR